MPFNICQTLFPNTTIELLNETSNKSVILKLYNKISILQLGICRVQLKHTDKQLTCKCFVVQGNGTALLGMPDIELLSILCVKCNTVHRPQRCKEINAQTMEDNIPKILTLI